MTAVAAYDRKVSHLVRFDRYEADLLSGELRKSGTRVPLREQSFQALAALLERPGELVTRDELCHRLWHGDVFVDFENNLNAVVAHLRQALCDSAEHPRFIETLPKRGYRFIATVSDSTEESVKTVAELPNGALSAARAPSAPTAHWFFRSRRALAASIQLLFFFGWVFLYGTVLDLSAKVSDPTLARVISHRDSLFWSLLVGICGCVAELLIAVLMARRATSQQLLDRLFAVYCPLNVFGGLLLLGWVFQFLPRVAEALVIPVLVLFFFYGPFVQRKLLADRS